MSDHPFWPQPENGVSEAGGRTPNLVHTHDLYIKYKGTRGARARVLILSCDFNDFDACQQFYYNATPLARVPKSKKQICKSDMRALFVKLFQILDACGLVWHASGTRGTRQILTFQNNHQKRPDLTRANPYYVILTCVTFLFNDIKHMTRATTRAGAENRHAHI